MRNFIRERLNKDNLGNLIFSLGMFTGIAIAFATDIMILSWVTIIGVPWFVRRKSLITFDKEKLEFTTSCGNKIKKSGAEFIILIFVSFGTMALVGLILDALKVKDSPLMLVSMLSIILFIPILYCVVRNFPIAVYFKKEAWGGDGIIEPYSSSENSRNNSHHLSNASNTQYESLITSPRYRDLSCNIFHNR